MSAGRHRGGDKDQGTASLRVGHHGGSLTDNNLVPHSTGSGLGRAVSSDSVQGGMVNDAYQREHLRRQLDTARLLLGYLRAQGVELTSLTQPTVDRWLIRHRSRQRYGRPFLLWAASTGLTPVKVAIGTSARTGDREIMSDTDRVLLAVRLETDDTVALVDRVAGRLVLQYGQSSWRLVNLTVEHVLVHPYEPDILGLRLRGRDPLWLRPRLSALLRRLVDQRRPLAAALRRQTTPFLFPGMRAGRPAGR